MNNCIDIFLQVNKSYFYFQNSFFFLLCIQRDLQIGFCSVTVDSFKAKSHVSRGMYYSLCEMSMFLRMI